MGVQQRWGAPLMNLQVQHILCSSCVVRPIRSGGDSNSLVLQPARLTGPYLVIVSFQVHLLKETLTRSRVEHICVQLQSRMWRRSLQLTDQFQARLQESLSTRSNKGYATSQQQSAELFLIFH